MTGGVGLVPDLEGLRCTGDVKVVAAALGTVVAPPVACVVARVTVEDSFPVGR